MPEKQTMQPRISRREAFRLAGAAGAVALVGRPRALEPAAAQSTTTPACVVSPALTEGPYFVDDSATGYNRSNILSNLDGSNTQTGVPFTLTLYVYDAKNSCAAMPGVQVDIWHCNATGVYSAESSESTSSQTWLRGYQLTDSSGKVQFTTIIPGWYSGRAVSRTICSTAASIGMRSVEMARSYRRASSMSAPNM